ncbi:MAG: hypothetical protein WBD07_14450 [Vicinamibacterales bacterium]
MRRILAAVGMVVLTSSVCYGQVTPNLAKGSKALVFEFNGLTTTAVTNSTTGPISGAGFKYYLSPVNAVRGILELAMTNNTIAANPGTGQTGIDGSNKSSAVGVAVALEHHMGMGRLSPYIGAGGLFRTSSSETVNAVVGNPPGPQTTTKNGGGGSSNQFGGFGTAGFEFFLTNQVSVSGEYRLTFTATSPKDQEVTTGATTTTTKFGSQKNLGLNSSGFLTMSFYF